MKVTANFFGPKPASLLMKSAAASVLLVFIAGCAGSPPGPPESSAYGTGPAHAVACAPAAEAPAFLLEAHTDHAWGRTYVYALWPDGTVLTVEGFMAALDRNGTNMLVFDDAVVAGATETEACAIMQLVPDLGPGASQVLESYWIGKGQADRDIAAGFLAGLEGFMALDAEESAHCWSGGDAWAQAHVGNNVHRVEARCAGTPEFTSFRVGVEELAEPFSSGF